jgi:predicted ATP-binding protein involved in virulence
MQFTNTMDGFKAWNRAFPHLMNSDIKARSYYKKESYYLELNKVQISSMSNEPFLGCSLRGYNEEDKDFSTMFTQDEQKQIITDYFAERVRKFCIKHGCQVRY